MSSEALIKLVGIEKSFKDAGTEVHVIRGLDFIVNPGDYIAIKGTSGAGKSTFLHILGLLDKPNSGEVYFSGKNVTHCSDKQLSKIRNHKIGFVFQFHHLMPDFNALENVLMPKMIEGRLSSADKKKAKEILDRVGLSERMKHLPSQLSGGERQRVAMARALIQQPKLLLADEPSGNLDEENTESLHQLFSELHRETGVSIVVVTHDPTLYNKAHQRCVMQEGLIVSEK